MDLLILEKNYMIMQEASFTNLFKTIMWIIAFYYIFKFLAKIFLPVLVKKAVEKAGENFQRQQQYSQDNYMAKNTYSIMMKSSSIRPMQKILAKPKRWAIMLITKK